MTEQFNRPPLDRRNSPTSTIERIGLILWWAFGCVIFAYSLYVWIPRMAEKDFYTKVTYAQKYRFSYDAIDVARKPYDCEWGTAPLGEKHCHYEAEALSSYQSRKENIKGHEEWKILTCSYNLGKTWKYDDCLQNAPDRLFLGWKRVEH